MKFNVDYSMNLGNDTQIFYSLLKEEDFNFKTKNIHVLISMDGENIVLRVTCDSIIDLKIGTTAVQKSLDIIEKTLAF